MSPCFKSISFASEFNPAGMIFIALSTVSDLTLCKIALAKTR